MVISLCLQYTFYEWDYQYSTYNCPFGPSFCGFYPGKSRELYLDTILWCLACANQLVTSWSDKLTSFKIGSRTAPWMPAPGVEGTLDSFLTSVAALRQLSQSLEDMRPTWQQHLHLRFVQLIFAHMWSLFHHSPSSKWLVTLILKPVHIELDVMHPECELQHIALWQSLRSKSENRWTIPGIPNSNGLFSLFLWTHGNNCG